MQRPGNPYTSKWLWKTAFLIVLVGFAFKYALPYLFPPGEIPRKAEPAILWAMFLGAGTCVICATAGWWLKR